MAEPKKLDITDLDVEVKKILGDEGEGLILLDPPSRRNYIRAVNNALHCYRDGHRKGDRNPRGTLKDKLILLKNEYSKKARRTTTKKTEKVVKTSQPHDSKSQSQTAQEVKDKKPSEIPADQFEDALQEVISAVAEDKVGDFGNLEEEGKSAFSEIMGFEELTLDQKFRSLVLMTHHLLEAYESEEGFLVEELKKWDKEFSEGAEDSACAIFKLAEIFGQGDEFIKDVISHEVQLVKSDKSRAMFTVGDLDKRVSSLIRSGKPRDLGNRFREGLIRWSEWVRIKGGDSREMAGALGSLEKILECPAEPEDLSLKGVSPLREALEKIYEDLGNPMTEYLISGAVKNAKELLEKDIGGEGYLREALRQWVYRVDVESMRGEEVRNLLLRILKMREGDSLNGEYVEGINLDEDKEDVEDGGKDDKMTKVEDMGIVSSDSTVEGEMAQEAQMEEAGFDSGVVSSDSPVRGRVVKPKAGSLKKVSSDDEALFNPKEKRALRWISTLSVFAAVITCVFVMLGSPFSGKVKVKMPSGERDWEILHWEISEPLYESMSQKFYGAEFILHFKLELPLEGKGEPKNIYVELRQKVKDFDYYVLLDSHMEDMAKFRYDFSSSKTCKRVGEKVINGITYVVFEKSLDSRMAFYDNGRSNSGGKLPEVETVGDTAKIISKKLENCPKPDFPVK